MVHLLCEAMSAIGAITSGVNVRRKKEKTVTMSGSGWGRSDLENCRRKPKIADPSAP
jgi:hypothetical protein